MHRKYVTSGSRFAAGWLYCYGGLGCVSGIVEPVLFTPSLVKTYLYPSLNLVLFFAGSIVLIIHSIFFIVDANKIWKTERAIQFDPDCLYIFQFFRKIKIRYDDILEVKFRRFPIGGGKRSRMTIKTKNGNTGFFVGDTSSVISEFQKLQISANVVATPLLVYVLFAVSFGSLLVFPQLTGLVLLMVMAGLLVFGFWSKRGDLSRKFELSCFLFPIWFSLFFVATIVPLSQQDREYRAMLRLRKNNGVSDLVQKCEELRPDSHPKILNLCAWTLVTTNDVNLRNYPLAEKYATDALMRAENSNSKRAIADTLACAHMAQNHREEAMRLVSEYSLSDRSREFSKNIFCK